MYGIGELARSSGLSVSALRFYDGAGVLVPARVDPVTGYRRYAAGQLAEARLLARLRRVAMPLADARLVLAAWSGGDGSLVAGLLAAHLRRLETGLADARVELSALRSLLEDQEKTMATRSHPSPVPVPVRLTVPAGALAAALDAVRFAVGGDPALPMLHGVLFDAAADGLRLVATDRYRMAVAHLTDPGGDGAAARLVVPGPLADGMRALLGGADEAVLTLDGTRVTLRAGGGELSGDTPGDGFPDHRRLLATPSGRRTPVDVPALRRALADGPVRDGDHALQGVPYAVSLLAVTTDGTVAVVTDDGPAGEPVAVNRDFLLQALDAAGHDHLELEFAGPTAPLILRAPDRPGHPRTFSLLMPVRLTA